MKILDPTGAAKANEEKKSSRIAGGLTGKVVGILSNVWPSYEDMIVRFREQLVEKHQVAKINYYEIPRTRAAPDELLDKVAAECDAAIVGLGN